jgi:hypothetical protein
VNAHIDQKLKENGVTAAQYLRDWGHKLNAEDREYLQKLDAPPAVAVEEPPQQPAETTPQNEPVTTAPVIKRKKLPPIPDTAIEEEQQQSRYVMFVLYDPNNPAHRERQNLRTEYSGYYFLRSTVKPEKEAEFDAQWAKYERLPIGVVQHGKWIHDAYIPAENSTDLNDIQWLNRARALRAAADYDDALYAEWPDLQTKLTLTCVTGPGVPSAATTSPSTFTRRLPSSSSDALPSLTFHGTLPLATPPITRPGFEPMILDRNTTSSASALAPERANTTAQLSAILIIAFATGRTLLPLN